jgi:hypothetical protein
MKNPPKALCFKDFRRVFFALVPKLTEQKQALFSTWMLVLVLVLIEP